MRRASSVARIMSSLAPVLMVQGLALRRCGDQCLAAGVAFFFKQWGGVRKSKAGRSLNGRTYDEFPSTVTRKVPSARNCNILENPISA